MYGLRFFMEQIIRKFVLIVAGGAGNRMNTDLPKQFLKLNNIPILVHTLKQFYDAQPHAEFILVLPKKDLTIWENICLELDENQVLENAFKIFVSTIKVVIGGSTRFQSVKNGLDSIAFSDGIIAIHDGVRPFIRPKIINQSFEVAQQKGCAIVAVTPKDSIRIVGDKGKNIAQNRSSIRLVQTPQTFDLRKLKLAYQTEEKDFFTDDASVFEYNQNEIYLIEGDYQNIKITTPEDLAIGQWILDHRKNAETT